MGSGDDNLQTATRDRMSLTMTTQKSASQLRDGKRSEPGQAHTVPVDEARRIVADWPAGPHTLGEQLLDHYGAPNEATPTKLWWYRQGPWARMELTADEIVHDFPAPHTDFFTQYVDYPINTDAVSELVKFDGSVLIDRTAGQIGARCDHEAFNTLTINLAVEIMQGKRTVDDARHLYAETTAAFAMGRDAPYAEALLFTPPSKTADPDEAAIGGEMMDQVTEKLKDLVGEGETPR